MRYTLNYKVSKHETVTQELPHLVFLWKQICVREFQWKQQSLSESPRKLCFLGDSDMLVITPTNQNICFNCL